MESKLLEVVLHNYGIPTAITFVFILFFLKLYFPAEAKKQQEKDKVFTNAITMLIENDAKQRMDFKEEMKEARKLTVDTVATVMTMHKESLHDLTMNQERLMKQISDHNATIHNMYAQKFDIMYKGLDGIVLEMKDFKKEISGRIEMMVSKIEKEL